MCRYIWTFLEGWGRKHNWLCVCFVGLHVLATKTGIEQQMKKFTGGKRMVECMNEGRWGIIRKLKATKGEASGKGLFKCICMLTGRRNLGCPPVCCSFSTRPCAIRSGLTMSAVMNRQNSPCSAQGQRINHGKPNAIWHSRSLFQSMCHPWAWLNEYITVWNEEIKGRTGWHEKVTRQSCHSFPVIRPCSRWCIALWKLDCCSYIIYKKRQNTFSLIAARLLSKQGNGGKKRTKGVMMPSDFHSFSVYYWGRISRLRNTEPEWKPLRLFLFICGWLCELWLLYSCFIVRASLSSKGSSGLWLMRVLLLHSSSWMGFSVPACQTSDY